MKEKEDLKTHLPNYSTGSLGGRNEPTTVKKFKTEAFFWGRDEKE